MQPTSTASNPLFDRDFLLATMMGPNCVRFAEELTANIPFSPNMRVLDLGCGMGLSSIYLARTFGVRVFAADLWINPSDNFARFRDFGLEDAVIPLRAEGHALPFAEGYFDAVICIDAYHFFGCDPEYLDAHIAPLVKPGGFIAPGPPAGIHGGHPRRAPALLEGRYQFPLRRMVGRTLETVHPRRRTGRLLPPQPQSRMGGLAPVRQPLCTARCRHDGKGRLALLRLHRHHRYRVPGSLFGTVPSIIR